MFGPFVFSISEVLWIDRDYDLIPDSGNFGYSQSDKSVTRRNRMLHNGNRRRGDVGIEI